MLIRLTAVALAMLTSSAAAQRPPTLTRLEAGSCPGCTVTLEKLAVIGKATDAELLPEYGRLTALADGGYVFAGGSGSTPILRYDRTGKYLGTVGRIGDGPGEYRSAQSVVRARGDSLSVMGGRRIATISLVSGRGRSEPVPPKIEGFFHVVLPDGRVIVNSSAQEQATFALLSPTSTLISRFGPLPPKVVLPNQGGRTITDSYATWVSMAVSPSGAVWTGLLHYAHRRQKVAPTGAVLVDIARKPSWHSPYTYADIDEKMYRLGELRTPRSSTMTGLGIDPAGFLVTMSRVADANWKADPKAPPPHPPGVEYPVEQLVPTGGIDRYVDTILEVYREADGAFLGSWRSDAVLGSMMSNGLISLKTEDADGVESYTIYRVKVSGAK
jgi:hypothetical protein